MQRVKIMGLAIVAMLALSGLAVSSASASLFLFHPTGKILGEATNTQVFEANGTKFECKKATFSGTATALRALTVLVEVIYTECSTPLAGLVEVSPAQFILNADLKVAVENTVKVTVPAAGCSLSIGPAGNQELNSVHYATEGADLKINALAKGITFTTTGGECVPPGTNATYNGQAKIMSGATGGVVRWDK